MTSEFLLATVSDVNTPVSVQLSDSLSNYRNIRLIAQNTNAGANEFTVAEVSVAFFKAHCTDNANCLQTGALNTTGGAGIYYSNDTTIYARRVATYNANVWIYGVGKIS